MNTQRKVENIDLTADEIQCLQLAGFGKPREEMAAILNLPQEAISDRLSQALEKLDVDNLMAAVAIAARTGIISR